MIERPLETPDIAIEVEDPKAMTVELPGLTIELGGEESPEDEFIEHNENLAEHIDPAELGSIGNELVQAYDADKQSRKDWEDTYIKGLELLGLKIEDRTTPWPGACGVYHPILSEAVIRFQSQAIMETFPAGGPVRTKIVGEVTPEREKQAERVEQELNYQVQEKMTEFRPEMEQMLFQLPLAGSAFKKTYYDPNYQRAVSAFVPAEDFVVAYGTTELESCARYTHVMRLYPNEVKRFQASGFYLDVDLPEPSPEYSEIQKKKDDLSGASRPSVEYDDRHTLLEIHADLDLKGFEDTDDNGEETGIALPYIVTIERQSKQVLSIRKNWDEEDPLKRRKSYFTHYKYLPGLGFYGSGLTHLIGGIAKSSTSILRQLIDAGTLSNLPGGLKSRGLRIKGDDTPIMPGEFRDVDIPGGAIRDNITFLPYKEPSQTLFTLMNTMVEEGRRFASIGELPIGSAQQNAPVGTTLALMERAMKVMSAIQARIHDSFKKELNLIADVIKEYMPEQYDYDMGGRYSRHEDFDDRIDIIPVSDPNSATMAQRVISYQAALQLASQAPNLYDLNELHRGMLNAMGIQNLDKVLPNKDDIKPRDPVTENMAVLTGKPVKAFLYQDHEAHIATHMAAMQDPKILQIISQSPMAQSIAAAAAAHITEHVAFKYRQEVEKQLGFDLPPEKEDLPEDIEYNLSSLISQAAGQLLQKDQAEAQQQQIQQQQQDPVIQMQQQDLQIRQAEVQRKAAKDQADNQFRQLKEAMALKREQMRLETQEKIAGAQIGAKVGELKETLASREKTDGARIGVDIAKTLRGG
jgi:hypothetical protein